MAGPERAPRPPRPCGAGRGAAMVAVRVAAIAVVVIFAVLMAAPAAAQAVPSEVSGRISLVESADAPGHIAEDRLARVYWDLIREQKLSLKQLPSVLVFH